MSERDDAARVGLGLLEHVPMPAWIEDRSRCLVHVNAAFVGTFGGTGAGWAGRSLQEALPALPEALPPGQATRRGSGQDGVEVVDGNRHLLCWRMPLPDARGLKLWGGLCVDITARVEVEEALEDTLRRQRQASAVRDRMLALLSHDVRSPLAATVGLLDVLVAPGSTLTPEEVVEALPTLGEQAGRTLRLVDDVLTWMQASVRLGQSARRPLDLGVRLEAVRGLLAQELRSAGVELDVSALEAAGATGDPVVVEMVLRNVLANAIRFSPRGSVIAVSTVTDDRFVDLCIDDQGAGITDAALRALRAGQGQPSRAGTDGETGHGIGLSLCRDLLVRAGGDLLAARRSGGGTRFVIRLPRARPGPVRQLVYVSEACIEGTPFELSELLTASRSANAAADIGGVLLFSGTRFLQVLEGPSEAVGALMARIQRDPRHHRVTTLRDGQVRQRGFQDWSMAFADVDDALVERVCGGELDLIQAVPM